MQITQSPSGKVINSPKGYRAFVPNPLPPIIEWDTALVSSLSRADFIIGKLAREGSLLPNPHLLMRPFITREAVLSSKIEGTQATIGDILAADAGAQAKGNPEDLEEVNNYIKALDHGVKRLEALPLSLRLIKEIHEILMEGVRGSHASPGEFRSTQNWIGAVGSTINTARFIPPPPDVLMECLGEFETFLHNRQLPSLIHIGLCHYQFESIHPFLDGNGRIGRLLIILLLIEENILPAPLLYVSAFFEASREDYYRELYSVSSKGTWKDWLIYFLNGLALQSEDVLSRAERINALLNNWKLEVASNSSLVPVGIIDCLAVNPYITINRVSEELNVAYKTAQRGVEKLKNMGFIQLQENKKRNKVYCAEDILSILEEPTNLKPSS